MNRKRCLLWCEVTLMVVLGLMWFLSPLHGQAGSNAPGLAVAEGQSAEGSIGGRVVRVGKDEPLPGVDVFVMGAPVPPQKTDASGRFRFDRLVPGRYGLMLHPGSGYRSRDTVVVLQGNHKVSGVELKAYSAATIAGRVRDVKGRPVAGLSVSALRLNAGGPRFPPDRGGAPALTNDLGEYRLSGLTPGRYGLLVETKRLAIAPKTLKEEEPTESEATAANVRTYYPNGTSLDSVASFPLAPGEDLAGMDITLARERTYCVRSRVMDPSTHKVTRVQVQISAGYYLGSADLAKGEVPAGKGFEVCGLPPGEYRLLAAPLDSEGNALYASEPFSVTKQSLRLPDVSLRPLIQLRGRLTIETTGQTQPLSGAVAITLSENRPFIVHEQALARVTEPGSFVIPAVLPDEYWLTVKAPAGFYVKSATVAGRDALRSQLHPANGELDIVLGQNGPTLSVQVSDWERHPIPSASVLLGREPLPAAYAPDDLIVALTDQNGQATLKGIAPGTYRLLAFAEAWIDPYNVGDFYRERQSQGEEISVAPGEQRALAVKPVDLTRK